MNQTTERTRPTVSVPDGLESASGKLCYTYLSVSGPSTIGELASALGLKRLELFPLLEQLREHRWIQRAGDRYALVTSQ